VGRWPEVEPSSVPVLVVDDQEPFRRAARVVLDRADGFELVGEAESGEDALATVEELHPQLVLMDINMPGINGIETTRRIVDAHPGTTVILLSTYLASDLPAEAKTSGAVAYLNKEDLTPRVLRRLWQERHDGGWRVG
jgi:two-component system invasion response regulator UvrY